MEDAYVAARQYLSDHNVLCLATSLNDQPWVAPVFYCTHAGRLIFLSAPHTQHCNNMSANPNVSASVQEDYKDWSEIKGIQLSGRAGKIPAAATESVIQAYSCKFPVTGDRAPVEIANALEKIHWFEVQVEKLLFIDNSKGLGHRVELEPGRLFSI